MRSPISFEQAVQLAERYDAMLYTSPRSQAIPFGHGSGPTPMELGAITDQRRSYGNNSGQRNGYHTASTSNRHDGSNNRRPPQLTPELRQQLIKDGKCFYCRLPGHRALDCAQRKRDLSK